MADKLSGSPTAEIVAQVNDLGLTKAAQALNTSPATLSRWLKSQNYQLKRIYVPKEEMNRDPQRN